MPTFDKGVSFLLDFSIGPVGSFTVAGSFNMAGGNFVSVRGESGSGIEELERNIHAVIAKIANRTYRTGLPNPDDMAAGYAQDRLQTGPGGLIVCHSALAGDREANKLGKTLSGNR